MSDVDYPVNDFDNHYYEAIDAFTRHLDPAPRTPHHPVGGDRRPQVPRDRRQGQPRGGEPDVRPDRQGRRDVGVLPRQPVGSQPDSSTCASASRSGPSTATATRGSQVMDEQGLDKVWLFPTLGMIYEQLLKHDPEGVGIMFRAFNRWLEEDWGYDYEDRIFAVAVHRARRRRRRGRGARAGAVDSAPASSCMRPAAPTTMFGPLTPGDPDVRPVLGPGQRGGHHRRRARGRQRLLAQRLRQGGLLRRVLRRRAVPVIGMHVDRARDLRLPRVADLRPAVRPLPEPARRVGRERRRVPARPVPEAASRSTARSLASSTRTRSRRSGATSGSTRSGRTTSTRSSTSWAPTGWSSAPTGRTSRACRTPLRLRVGDQRARPCVAAVDHARQRGSAQPAPAGLNPSNIRRIADDPCAPATGARGESRISDIPAAMRSMVASRSTRPCVISRLTLA